MAWNHSETTDENQNKESKILKKPECKRPKCVAFAFWWFIVLGIIVPAVSFVPGAMGDASPWTEYAGMCIVGLLMLDCARMISKRNIIAVSLATLTLFISAWILADRDFAFALTLPPMIFIVLPHSIRWLRLNNRFSVSVLLGSIVMVSVSCRLYFMSSISDTVISNTNPLFVAVPGDKAHHELNGDCQHVYRCRYQNLRVSTFIAQYNHDGECRYVKLDGFGALFLKNATDICNERFDDRILWSNGVMVKERETEDGLPILCGTVDKKIITIFQGAVDCFDYGTLLICDSQLNSELDFLFALPDENDAMAPLNYFLDNRDRILSVELDDDDNQRKKRNDIYERLLDLRDRANRLGMMSSSIDPQIGHVEDPRVAKKIADFELRRKTMCELAKIISITANMAVTAIEYNTKALAMRREERIKYRRQYLEKDSPVPEELLPIDPTDHSGQSKVFDWAAKLFKEGREELYWELHEKTGYSLGRPYNPEHGNRGRRQSSVAPDQSAHKKNDPNDSFYGSKDRQKLYSRPYRNGLGMY